MSASSTTIYSGFYRKLKDRRLTWEDRLKIARYAWTTPAAFIPNKHQVLLDWLFGALLNKKKLKIAVRDELLTWLTLNDFVRSNFIKSLASKSQLLSIRSSATQVMMESLSRASLTQASDFKLLSWMLGACHAVLTASPISFLLTSRAKVLHAVLASSLRLLLQLVQLEKAKVEEETDAMETDDDPVAAEERQRQKQRRRHSAPTPQLKKVIEAFALAAIDAFLRSKGRRGVDEKQILQFYLDEVMETQLCLVAGEKLETVCSEGASLRSKLKTLADVVLFDVGHKIHYENFLRGVASAVESVAPGAASDAPVAEGSGLDELEYASTPVKPTIPPLIKSVFDKLKSHVSVDPRYVASVTMVGLKSLNLPASRRFTAAMLLAEAALEKKKDASSSDVAVLRAVFEHIAGDGLIDLLDEVAKARLRFTLDLAVAFVADRAPNEDVFALLVDLLKCDPQILEKVAVDALRLTLMNGAAGDEDVVSERDRFFTFFVYLYKKLRRLDKWFLHLEAAILSAGGVGGGAASEFGLSSVALKTIEDVGENLPLGTALTIWENLHEAQERVMKMISSAEKILLKQMSSLMRVEVSFLQKLALANHEHPENLSANVQDSLVAMGNVEKMLRETESLLDDDCRATLNVYRECRQRLEATLSFYLPRRHSFPTNGVYSPRGYCFTDENGIENRVAEVLLAPSNWLPYYCSQIPDEFLRGVISIALEKALGRGSHHERLRYAAVKFLKDESNYDIPSFVPELMLQIVSRRLDIARSVPAESHSGSATTVDDVDVFIDLLRNIPLYLIEDSAAGKLVVKLLSLFHEKYEEISAVQKERVISFVETLLIDFPQCLDSSPTTFSLEDSPPAPTLSATPLAPSLADDSQTPSLEDASQTPSLEDASQTPSLEDASPTLGTLLDLCRLSFLASDERRRFHSAAIGRSLISVAAKLVKIGFRRDAILPLCDFLEKCVAPCGDEGATACAADVAAAADAQLAFLLPLLSLAYYGSQKLLRRKSPTDDAKLQRRELRPRLERAVRYVVDDLFLNKSVSLSVGSVVSIVKTFLGTSCNAMISTRLIEDGTTGVGVADRMIARLLDLETERFTFTERLAFVDCSKAVLRRPEWAIKFRDGFFRKHKLRIDLSHDRFLEFFLRLLPPLPKNDANDADEVVAATTGELPTESFSVLDRFLDRDTGALESDSYHDDVAMDDARSYISKPTSIGAPTVDEDSADAPEDAHASSLIDCLLLCLQSLRGLESPSSDGKGDELTVSSKMISLISVASIDVDHRRLDLALRYCLDAFDNDSSSKSLSNASSRQFIDAVQNLAFGLAMKCKAGGLTSNVDRAVSLSIILCLSKIVKLNSKTKRSEEVVEEEKIHQRPAASVAVETLLTLPVPVHDDPDSRPSLAEFFLRYAEVVSSLVATHLHRVFAMAPTFFMTIDKLLKILAGICDGLTSTPAEDSDDQCDPSRSAAAQRKSARDCANALLRILALFRPHKTELSKLAPYWISHFTRVMTTTPSIGNDAKIGRDLNSCVFCLMDLLDEYGFDILRTRLPAREKELLHKLKKEYEATFKFKGKI